MEKTTIRETYGIQLLLDLEFEAELIDEIAGMREDEIVTWSELIAMDSYACQLIRESDRWLDGESLAEHRARGSALMAEVTSIMAAAERYRLLRRALDEIRAGERIHSCWVA